MNANDGPADRQTAASCISKWFVAQPPLDNHTARCMKSGKLQITKIIGTSKPKMAKCKLNLKISTEPCSMQTKQGNPRLQDRGMIREARLQMPDIALRCRPKFGRLGSRPALAPAQVSPLRARSWQGLWGNQNLSKNRIYWEQLLPNLSKFYPNPLFPSSTKSWTSQWSFWATAVRVSTAETVHMCARDSGLESSRALERGRARTTSTF